MEPNKETKIEVQGDVGQMNTGDINHQTNYYITVIASTADKGIEFLKNTIFNNVRVSYSDEEWKEAHARLIKLCIMFIISAFVVAFFYPVLFENSEMGILATRLSDVVAGGFLLTTAGFIKFRDMARAAICENLRKRNGDKK